MGPKNLSLNKQPDKSDLDGTRDRLQETELHNIKELSGG